ncbi:MAG: RluA family pseudouridine synthase [Phycisphaerales bacterium]|nr:RluA family pseudouridine synthase [Phycisphaerales bacterium]
MPEPSARPRNHGIDPKSGGSDRIVRIISQGNHWVVVEKPANLLSVPGRGPDRADCVTARVAREFPAATGPLTVHRLDMETSGLMVFALSPAAHAALSAQFMRREVTKRYIAVLDGDIDAEAGQVNLPLISDWPNRPRQMVCHDTGKPSQTDWRVLDRAGGRTRVEFVPRTGRTHQLRLHAATPRQAGGLGAPIVGDSLYGRPDPAGRLLLHASALGFADPDDASPVHCTSDPPF